MMKGVARVRGGAGRKTPGAGISGVDADDLGDLLERLEARIGAR
jgi:hypothetical protein